MNNGKVLGNQLSLVLYGSNLFSTVGSLRFTALERHLIKIPKSVLSVFIGIILSDANIQKLSKGGEARLQFKQKYGQFEYFFSVFFQLSHYCSRVPYTTKAILHKKLHYGLGFTTRSLSCITELYHLFYPPIITTSPFNVVKEGKGKKIIPENIYSLLT